MTQSSGRLVITLLGSVLILAGAGEGRTQDGRDVPVTPLREIAWGERQLEAYLQDHPISEEIEFQSRLDEIGRQLVAVSDQPHAPRQFLLLTGDEMQALAFPDGTVCVTEGLSRGLDDHELAFSVAHELSHIDLRHSTVALRLERLLPGKSQPSSDPSPLALKLARSHEREADRFGVLYAVRAGFDFSAGLTALDKLAESAPRQKDRFHPRFSERRAELEEFRAELEAAINAFDFGIEALAAGHHDDAVDDFRLFVGEYPNCVEGRINLGVAYLARGRAGVKSPGGLFESLPIVPEQTVIVLRGLAENRGDLLNARNEFGMALKLDPGNANALAGSALVYLRMDNVEEALRASAEALERAPDNPEILLCAANSAFLAEKFADAEQLYRKALELRPGWPPAERNLARLGEVRSETAPAPE